jgi:hypothetical protein
MDRGNLHEIRPRADNVQDDHCFVTHCRL